MPNRICQICSREVNSPFCPYCQSPTVEQAAHSGHARAHVEQEPTGVHVKQEPHRMVVGVKLAVVMSVGAAACLMIAALLDLGARTDPGSARVDSSAVKRTVVLVPLDLLVGGLVGL